MCSRKLSKLKLTEGGKLNSVAFLMSPVLTSSAAVTKVFVSGLVSDDIHFNNHVQSLS